MHRHVRLTFPQFSVHVSKPFPWAVSGSHARSHRRPGLCQSSAPAGPDDPQGGYFGPAVGNERGMNLDKASAADTEAPLAPPEWTMELARDGSHFTAAVARSGVVLCRLSAMGAAGDEPKIRRALANKARWWIHEFLARNG